MGLRTLLALPLALSMLSTAPDEIALTPEPGSRLRKTLEFAKETEADRRSINGDTMHSSSSMEFRLRRALVRAGLRTTKTAHADFARWLDEAEAAGGNVRIVRRPLERLSSKEQGEK
jgi:hypothetical protein